MRNNDSNHHRAKGRISQRLGSVLFMLPAWFSPHKRLRVMFHRWRGVNIGRNVEIGYFCILDNVHPHLITIEDEWLWWPGPLFLLTIMRTTIWGEPVTVGPTRICKNAFIGVGAVIMPTLTIGEARSLVQIVWSPGMFSGSRGRWYSC